jgi:FMN phosphatase YigB (HAD superfamily)
MIFVGNEMKDVQAALAFGCEAILLDRKRAVPDWKQHRTISTLAEL